MGFDLKLHDETKAAANGIDLYFSEESVTVHGWSRLRKALSMGLNEDLAYKLSFNDGKLVTPQECTLMAQHLEDLLELNAVEVQTRPELFRDWVKFCRTAVDYGGFEVW